MRLPADIQSDETFSEKDFNNIALKDSFEAQPFAYQYSKVSSEKKAWEYMETHKPNFDLIFLLAPSILGRSPEPVFTATKESLGGRVSYI
jgi:NADPH-dependent methylglyoxal reductase